MFRRSVKHTLDRSENMAGYLFIAPSLFGFFMFSLFPLLLTIVVSFSEWNLVAGFQNLQFVGLRNYLDLFKDIWFQDSFVNNLYFTLFTIPTQLVAGLLLAILINKHCYGKDLFKMVYFLPYISSVVAVSTIWMVLFQPTFGPVNDILRALGMVNPPKWLADTKLALFTISMMYVWANTGYYIIIYISGLQGIPAELYESAQIDGANWFHNLIHITVPMITPTTFFLLITGIISSFKIFDPIQIMTEGGPGSASSVLVYYLYKMAFEYGKMGYASAIAMMLFGIIFIITYFQWNGQKKWVNYM